MTPEDLKDEQSSIKAEYKAIKSLLGGLILEHDETTSQDDVKYFQRKFEEARDKLKRYCR